MGKTREAALKFLGSITKGPDEHKHQQQDTSRAERKVKRSNHNGKPDEPQRMKEKRKDGPSQVNTSDGYLQNEVVRQNWQLPSYPRPAEYPPNKDVRQDGQRQPYGRTSEYLQDMRQDGQRQPYGGAGEYPQDMRQDGQQQPYGRAGEYLPNEDVRQDGQRQPYGRAGEYPQDMRQDGQRQPYGRAGEYLPNEDVRQDGQRQPYGRAGEYPQDMRQDGQRQPYGRAGEYLPNEDVRQDGQRQPYGRAGEYLQDMRQDGQRQGYVEPANLALQGAKKATEKYRPISSIIQLRRSPGSKSQNTGRAKGDSGNQFEGATAQEPKQKEPSLGRSNYTKQEPSTDQPKYNLQDTSTNQPKYNYQDHRASQPTSRRALPLPPKNEADATLGSMVPVKTSQPIKTIQQQTSPSSSPAQVTDIGEISRPLQPTESQEGGLQGNPKGEADSTLWSTEPIETGQPIKTIQNQTGPGSSPAQITDVGKTSEPLQPTESQEGGLQGNLKVEADLTLWSTEPIETSQPIKTIQNQTGPSSSPAQVTDVGETSEPLQPTESQEGGLQGNLKVEADLTLWSTEPIETGQPIKTNEHQVISNPPTLTQSAAVSEVDGPLLDRESQGTEICRTGEDDGGSNAVIRRIYSRICKANTDFTSGPSEMDISQSSSPNENVEMFLDALIRAYGSTCQGYRESEKALESKKAECENFKKAIAGLESRNKEEKIRYETIESFYERQRRDFQDEHRRERKESEEVHDNKVEKIRKKHEAEKEEIVNTLNKLQQEHQKQMASYEPQIQQLKSEIEVLKNEHEVEMDALKSEHEVEKEALRSEREVEIEVLQGKHEVEIQKLKQQNEDGLVAMGITTSEEMVKMKRDCENRVSELTESQRVEKEHYANWVENLHSQHQRKIQQMESDFNDKKARRDQNFSNEKAKLVFTIETERETHRTQLNSQKKKSDDDKQRMMGTHQNEMIRMKNEFDREIEEKAKERENIKKQHEAERETHRTQLNSQKKKSDDDKQRMMGAHQNEKIRMKNEFDREMEEKAKERENIKKQHDAEKKIMKEQQDAENGELRRKILHLTDRVNKLMGELAEKREYFPAMSDQELARSFQDLATEVDRFARATWDTNMERTWPFPESKFRTFKNPKRVKQHVVQNKLWFILYDKIFCTPFRVLGASGGLLERAWIERHGQGLEPTGALALCPMPTKDSEKWRYEAMKKCSEEISQPLSDRGDVKRGYESSVKGITEDICQELGNVTPMSGSDKQRINDFVRRAAKLWLEVGQQRYRAFLVMSEVRGRPSQSRQVSLNRGSASDLVVIPELRRFGNGEGGGLDKDVLISNCKGEFSEFKIG